MMWGLDIYSNRVTRKETVLQSWVGEVPFAGNDPDKDNDRLANWPEMVIQSGSRRVG